MAVAVRTYQQLERLLDAAERKIGDLESDLRALRRGNAGLESQLRAMVLERDRAAMPPVYTYSGGGGAITIRGGTASSLGNSGTLTISLGNDSAAPMTTQYGRPLALPAAQHPDGYGEMERRTAEVRAARDARNAPELTRFRLVEID